MLAEPSAHCADTGRAPSPSLGIADPDDKADMNLDVTLRIEGESRARSARSSLALYRGAQEEFTNVAPYAPSACTTVTLRYEPDRTTLSIDNGLSVTPAREAMGGGRGLAGLRERVERPSARVRVPRGKEGVDAIRC